MSDQIFIIVDGQSRGPYTVQQVRDAMRAGTVPADTLAAVRGGQDWQPVEALLAALAQGSGQNTATEDLLQTLRDRLKPQTAMERLGLAGDPSPMVIEKTFERLRDQLKDRLGDSPTRHARALARECLALLKEAVAQLSDPKERFILQRAADLGVDPHEAQNRAYLSGQFHRDEGLEAFKQGRMREALKHYDAILGLQPEDTEAQWRRAVALFRADPLRTQEALAALRQCAELNPDNVAPLRSLAELHLELGRRDEAKRLVVQALEVAPEDEAARQLAATLSGKAKGGTQPPEKEGSSGKGKTKKPKKNKDKATNSGFSDVDGFGFAKVAVVCALVFGALFQMAHKQPDPCFPQGDQEYLYQPGTYYEFRAPGGGTEPGARCPDSLHPPTGSNFFVQLEAEFTCRDDLEFKTPNVTPEELAEACAMVPLARPDSPRAGEANFFYQRRGILFIVGLLCIAFLGTGASIGERFKAIGFELDGTLGAAIGLGLIVGFFSPVQFTMAPLGTLLGLTALHVLCEEVFFRGFVTRKLLDSFTSPMAPVVLSGLIFGIYHITYTSFWWITPMAVPAWVGMVTVGAGIPYAALYARSNSILVPLIAHLTVNMLMMYRSHGAVAAIMG